MKKLILGLLLLPSLSFAGSLTLGGAGSGQLVIQAAVGSGSSVYPATATASFPFGLTASTVTVSSNTILPGATFYNNLIRMGGPNVSVSISSNTIMFGATFYANAPILLSTPVAMTNASGILGTTTNDNACVGCYGQNFSSSSQGLFNNVPTSAQWGDIVSVTLTAGDWDITGMITYGNNGATTAGATAVSAITSTAGNSGAGSLDGDNKCSIDTALMTTTTNFLSCIIPNWRQSINATATYYLKINTTYSVATPTVAGRISARRVR